MVTNLAKSNFNIIKNNNLSFCLENTKICIFKILKSVGLTNNLTQKDFIFHTLNCKFNEKIYKQSYRG